MYIHQLNEWPNFNWNQARLARLLAVVRHDQGRLLGKMEALGFPLREQASLQMLTEDVVKSSAIEGEKLDTTQVRSSIARRLGIEAGALPPLDRHVEGIVDVMLDATRMYRSPLTGERLLSWHGALFPTGRSGLHRITVGAWRDAGSGPMQVVSGEMGREKVHFEAPSHERLHGEIDRFLRWFNGAPTTDPVIASALAHFWFLTIHPFEDGNGRIARAIADMQLARSDNTAQRFYSMSAQIQLERRAYYDVLESSQRGPLDISPWIEWYLNCLQRAIAASEGTLAAVLAKARFWKTHERAALNERQRSMLNRLLDGFEGKLTSTKWGQLSKCSPDTALRDITELIALGMLSKEPAGGRSTGYRLLLE